MTLEKATLTPVYSGEGEKIEFMFNPNSLTFTRSMSLEEAEGARTDKGNSKVSFKHPNPYSLTINNILIDTYETKDASVLDYIKKFKKSVEFAEQGQGKSKRPPIYIFSWGKQSYLRCFVKKFTFKLTLFRADGTPVRASIDLDLEQVDLPNSQPGQGTPNPSSNLRNSQNRQVFLT